MPSSTPDWSALASKNERLAGHGPARSPQPAGRRARAALRAGLPGRPGRRTARRAAAGTAAVVALAGAGALPATAAQASASTSASWRIVKQVHAGPLGEITAVTAVSGTGAWAFDGQSSPTAWRRSGASWTKVAFPSKNGEEVVAAAATSPTDVWAFTTGGVSRALRWNGSHWAAVHTFNGSLNSAVVLSQSDVWAFGMTGIPGALGTWHYNGHTWAKVASGHGLVGGSGLSARSVWAFGGTDVAHWNGRRRTRTSVARLLPRKQELNGPSVTSMYAQSATSVWAVGDGNLEDEGGPLVVLHFNGHSWRKVASSGTIGYQNFPALAPDGSGGLWIPVGTSAGGTTASFLHYSAGHLRVTPLPAPANKIEVLGVAAIPHTASALAVGFTHSASSVGNDVVGTILQYGG
jgi:hypothetical protein